MKTADNQVSAKTKLLDAALTVIRSKGYAATTVDELCAEAGVTKGAFFHHFKTKEDLAVSAAQYWSTVTNQIFESAPYQNLSDPLDRLLGYVAFRKELLQGTLPEVTCLVGTMVQETYDSNSAIRQACHQSIFGHSSDVAKEIEAAKKLYAPKASWTPMSLALHVQAVIQGAFILAKSDQNAEVAAESFDHLERYIRSLFNR